MTAIPGITIKKNAKGKLTHVSIDVRKHREVIPALQELGLLSTFQPEIDVENTMTL